MTVFKEQLSRINIEPLITDGQHLLTMLRGQGETTDGTMVKSPGQAQQRTYPFDYFDEARKISLVRLKCTSKEGREKSFSIGYG